MTLWKLLLCEAALCLLLVVQTRLSGRLPPAGRAITQLQAVYAFLGLVARPLYQFLAQPGADDFLYDSRLAAGHYRDLVPLTLIALLGQGALMAAVGLYVRRRGDRPAVSFTPLPLTGSTPLILAALYAAGWTGRVGQLSGAGGILHSLAPFGVPAACLIVLLVKRRAGRANVVLLTIVAGELAWAALFASKTPVIAMLSALLIRAHATMTRSEMRRMYWALGAAGIASFLVLQPLKGIDTASRISESTTGGAVVGPTLGVLERFDALTSVADAYYYPKQQWLRESEFISRALTYALPSGGDAPDEASLGQRWTREVRTASVRYQFQDVPIAAGPTAEGLVVLGLAGVAAQNFIAALFILATSWGLSSGSIVRRTYWSYYAFGTTLYELGTLGQVGANAKALQLALCAGFLLLLLGRPRTPSGDQSSTATPSSANWATP